MIDNYVTGASGFIGKHLVSRLKGETMAISHKEIGGELFWMMPCRRFFFLSTYGNMSGHDDPRMILKANVGNVGRILSMLLDYGMAPTESFIYVSSSSVTLPVQTPYSRTKRAAEEMILAMPIPGCIVRPYSCTGVGEQREHLIPTLIRSCLEGEPMNFVEHATHDWVDVQDVVTALIALADSKATGVYEVGTGRATSNAEVLALVEAETDKKANVTIVPKLREYDSPEWVCRDSKSLSMDWAPSKPLATSIREMVEAYKHEKVA